VDISRGGIVERYAEIADSTRRGGRTLGQNDLWIAATASVVGATLLSTDKDFEEVEGAQLKHVWIDPTDR
jgi:tRNA(fMet)-specific endonuclease VapC